MRLRNVLFFALAVLVLCNFSPPSYAETTKEQERIMSKIDRYHSIIGMNNSQMKESLKKIKLESLDASTYACDKGLTKIIFKDQKVQCVMMDIPDSLELTIDQIREMFAGTVMMDLSGQIIVPSMPGSKYKSQISVLFNAEKCCTQIIFI